MAIPVIGEIWDGIRWLIDFFFSKVPKPILFLIFLVFITLTTILLGVVLHLVGIHCNINKEIVKTDPINVFDNAKIIFAARDTRNLPEYTFIGMFPQLVGHQDEIYFFARYRGSGLYEECTDSNDTVNCTYFLQDGGCFNCTVQSICFDKTYYVCAEWHSVCMGDAYYWVEPPLNLNCHNRNIFSKDIKIPLHYKFDSLTSNFTCVDLEYCGPNPTKPAGTELQDLLDGMGAVPYYQNQPYQHIDKAFVFTCVGFTPTISFFGIPVFDYRFWVLLCVIYIMFMFLSNIGLQEGITRR